MIIQSANRLNKIQEYYFSKKLREVQILKDEGKPIINLAIGNPDLPPLIDVIDVFKDAISEKQNHGYQPYKGITELRNAFADWYFRYFYVELNPEKEILPLMGSKEGIMHISLAFLNPGDEVLIPDPGYPTYMSATEMVGAKVKTYNLLEENNWYPDFNELKKMDLSNVKIMWVNYPHMPTGAKANNRLFEKLIDFAYENEILICNDNPYSFVLNDNPLSILSLPYAKEVCIELNSLSKSHNMAGWRVGMIAASEDYINTIIKVKSNFDSGMFKPIQLAAVKALSNGDSWYNHLNQIYQDRKNLILEILDLLQCTYDKNQGGMFVWARIPISFKNGDELSDYLLSKFHVFAAPGIVFGQNGDKYIRFSLCAKNELLAEVKRRIQQSRKVENIKEELVIEKVNIL
jgi:LL-diaminopimelate aminotransferase